MIDKSLYDKIIYLDHLADEKNLIKEYFVLGDFEYQMLFDYGMDLLGVTDINRIHADLNAVLNIPIQRSDQSSELYLVCSEPNTDRLIRVELE